MNANAGIVYRTPEIHVTGPTTHRWRDAKIADGNAITKPTATDDQGEVDVLHRTLIRSRRGCR